MASLAAWYREHGRHDLPWRLTTDRWAVLVSEVMLHQTQVSRVLEAWPGFIGRYPTPPTMAAVAPGEVIRAWGTLGYPRRARALWEAARVVSERGWPDDLSELPGVGRYTAAAVAAQADGADAPGVEANIRRVVERIAGRQLGDAAAEALSIEVGRPLRGRDRLLALMDVGALLCRPRAPKCDACPLSARCKTRGVLPDDGRRRQPRYEGSFRQRRGRVLAALRSGPQGLSDLDADALRSLEADGLAVITGTTARLP
ncbi:MAG: A/G-specific adenine glycosylase [Actinobacteria bacterium]|nr:A/G-specific adenine glycosylase [Actinomycetota bacterium]